MSMLSRTNKKLTKTLNQKGISLATCADSKITPQLISEGVGEGVNSKCFGVCEPCYICSLKAIKAADTQLMAWCNGCLWNIKLKEAKQLCFNHLFIVGKEKLCWIYSRASWQGELSRTW
mmetsp:Transcript_27906/g.36070  ORF Transcript_27906/g.36070 Transcript_27906/m.36070 type:complete len:119 (-) Transcript_27906:342-698(-)